MGERSFAEDVKQLGYGAGDTLRGEGILAITKALLQSGVSYVGGYPGAPISHLLDVMADANASLLKPMGIAIVGGLLLSQFITLYTTPVIYLYLDRLASWLRRRRGAEQIEESATRVTPTDVALR